MDQWLADLPIAPGVLAASTGALLVVAVALLVLWLRERGKRRVAGLERSDTQRRAFELESALAEQTTRLRMVGEVQDSAIMAVRTILRQADGARYAGESDPGAVVRSAATIGETARATLTELRRAQGVVRHAEGASDVQPGVASTDELFEVMRDAGLVIRVQESGERFTLTSGADLAVYRILQESLTNALEYGGAGTSVDIAFRWNGTGLRLTVEDDGARHRAKAPGADGQAAGYTPEEDAAALTDTIGGRGITEMRERAELFGGTFHATVVAGVGFSIAVQFPDLRPETPAHGSA